MNHVKEFKRCKSYWWCFKKAVKEYYELTVSDPEERKELVDNLLTYIMNLGGRTRAFVDGVEVKKFEDSWIGNICNIKDFLEKFNGREITIKATDLDVEIGIYPPQDADDYYRFDILDRNHPVEDEEFWKEFGEEHYYEDCQPQWTSL